MKESESCSGMFVEYRGIDSFVVIVNKTLSVENYFIFERVGHANEYWKPLIVRDELMLSYVDLPSFLINSFIVPMWVNFT